MEHSIQTVKDRFNSGEPLEYVFFWGHHTKLGKMTKACFSQWFPADFVVDDVAYNCTEQYMMAEKARVFGDDDIRQKMLASNDPKEIKALGRQVKNFDVETWRRVAPDIVVKILVEASPYDTIWGIGMQETESGVDNPENWKGTNFLGFALMEVRGILSGHSI